MALAMVPAIALTACDEPEGSKGSGSNDGGNGNEGLEGRYVFAATVEGTNGSQSVLLTGTSLDEGTLSPAGNGLVNDGATQWIFYRDYLYGLKYAQGNKGGTHRYILGEDLQMHDTDDTYNINRFSSYGMYNDDILTMATAESAYDADAQGYKPMIVNISYLNVVAGDMTTNNVASGDYSMENFVGNGEYVTLSGAEQSGSKLYCGVVPMGLSQYGVADGNGKWVRNEGEGRDWHKFIHTEAGGTGGGSYKANELSGTQWPDECWVAIYDNKSMKSNDKKLAHTNKISSPCGRFRSQYYQTVWADDKGDIYVFSPSYDKTKTDPLQQTILPAGVCRIKAGTDDFDPDYYVNLEEQTPGKNRSFMRCFPAGGSCFLMLMYDRALTEANAAGTELAIFNAETGILTYVTGIEGEISSLGKTVYTKGGKVYIPVNIKNESPAIYGIDIRTAAATRGVTIQSATEINGFGYMTPKAL